MHEIVSERANEGEGGRARKRIGSRGLRLNQSPHGRRGDEHHAQEQKAAPEENRGEELVFFLPQAIAQDAEEPEEGDAGEGQEAQGERHIAGAFLQPGPVSRGSTGSARQSNDRLQMNSTEKTIPAMAAARGVLSLE